MLTAALKALGNTDGGEMRAEPARMVLMHTGFGRARIIDMLVGDPLPRICRY